MACRKEREMEGKDKRRIREKGTRNVGRTAGIMREKRKDERRKGEKEKEDRMAGRKQGKKGKKEKGLKRAGLTLLKAQVGDFVDGRTLAVHEDEQLIQEELLFRVGEPAAVTADLHAAHHVLLRTSSAHRAHFGGQKLKLFMDFLHFSHILHSGLTMRVWQRGHH